MNKVFFNAAEAIFDIADNNIIMLGGFGLNGIPENCITASLKEFASLGKDIILAAALDRFEIWDSSKYKQLFEDFSPDTFSDLAKEVMAGKNVE